MTKTIKALDNWRTNGHMIADVAKLGYLDGRVVDTTYGENGGFWKVWRPSDLIVHDLKIDGVDFRNLPEEDASVDAVVMDPPYKLTGTPASPEMDQRYGTTSKNNNYKHVVAMVCAGISEAERVLRPGGYFLLKVQDQVEGGRVRWLTDVLTVAALASAFTKEDEFVFPSYRPQPNGTSQVHARRNYSTLLVFQRTKEALPVQRATGCVHGMTHGHWATDNLFGDEYWCSKEVS